MRELQMYKLVFILSENPKAIKQSTKSYFLKTYSYIIIAKKFYELRIPYIVKASSSNKLSPGKSKFTSLQ